MSKLVWRFGEVRIRVGMSVDIPRLTPLASSHLAKSWWDERRGWSSGLFTVHTINCDGGPHAVLSHKRTGCAICTSASILYLFELAERLAELDWSGRIEEFVPRNADAVARESREALDEARAKESGP